MNKLTKRPLECKLQQKIIKHLNDNKIFNFKAIYVNLRGVPDIFCLINGKAVFFEIKRDRDAKVTNLQKYTIQKIKDAKGYAFIVNNFEIFKKILYNIQNDSMENLNDI